MNIHIYWAWELPEHIEGLAVVVDVFAATSNITSLMSQETKQLFLVNDDSIDRVITRYPGAVTVGESMRKDLNFFDYSNAPRECMYAPVKNKTVIYMSNNGTLSIEAAINAEAKKTLAVSFLNIEAVSKWIRKQKVQDLTIIASGEKTHLDPKETADYECALALERLLTRKPLGWEKICRKVANYVKDFYPEKVMNQDYKLVMRLNRFPIVPLCIPIKPGLTEVKKAK